MIINHNMNALNAHRNMGINNTASGKSMEKLSSGLRINRAGDDAAGLSISEKMRGQIKGLNQASRNSQDGISYLQTAEGALTEVSEMLTRMKELVVQKENGTYNTDDISNINLELNSLIDEIKNIHDNTKFNGKNVFTETVNITVTQDAKASLAINNATLTGLNELIAKKDQQGTDPTGIATKNSAKVEDVESAITTVNTQRATYGSQQNRLEHTINNLNITAENLTAAESRIRDVDMASEMMTFSKNNILQQAAQAMLAQANQAPQGILQLLR